MKTWTKVEQDFYNGISQTELANSVNGKLYRFGCRPKNSEVEDIVIKVSSLDAAQLQSGTVAVMVFCKDLGGDKTGWLVPNISRIEELESLVDQLPNELRSLMPEYNGISLFEGVGNFEQKDTEEHFVSCKLKFNFLN